MAIRVFNADDHPMLRKGITDFLKESIELDWVGSAENGKIAYEKIKAIKPEIAIIDIEMPTMTGLEVAAKLLGEGSQTKFIIMTLFKEESYMKNAFDIGVHGYLLKESSEKDIMDCILQVHQNKKFIDPKMSFHLLKTDPKNSSLDNLTSHEIHILKLIASQKTTAEIAELLFISPKTVSNHRNKISKKLNLDGRQNGLLTWALENKDQFIK